MATRRGPLYAEVADLSFDTNGLATDDATAQLLDLLSSRWQREAAA